MATPLFNIGGLASGLDTSSIISQLMDLERIPINQMASRRAQYQQRNTAWDRISSRLSAVRTAVGELNDPDDWLSLSSATSSNAAAVDVTVTGSPPQTSLTFTVERLASSHQIASTGTFTALTDTVGAGTLSLTIGGDQHDIVTDADTTVAQLAEQIESLGIGVTASAVTVDTGEIRLFIRSETTGDASAFTVAADQADLGTFDVLEEGLDARIKLGSTAEAVTVERATNVFDDLIEGVAITLHETTSTPVTIGVNRDLDKAVDKVATWVNSLNSALSTLDDATRTTSDGEGAAGPLSGDSTARGLKLSIRSAISAGVAGLSGTHATASSVGISLNRDGSIDFDSAKLRTALESDFAGAMELFSRTTTATDSRVEVTRATSSDLDGTHAVEITQAATRATVTGDPYVAPTVSASFDITSGTRTAQVTIEPATDLAGAVAAINQALMDAGISTVTATSASGRVVLTETRHGSARSFDVSANDFGLEGTFAGQDVAGTIGGVAATGSGRTLSGEGTHDGMLLSVAATADQVAAAGGTLGLGTVTVTSGLAATFDEFLGTVLDSGGLIDRATDRWDAQIELADDRIEQLESRLDMREASLRRQYTALETALSRMSSMSASLASAMNSLPTYE